MKRKKKPVILQSHDPKAKPLGVVKKAEKKSKSLELTIEYPPEGIEPSVDMLLKRKSSITKKVYAILTADWHLRENTPIGRTDDFWNAQWKKVAFVSELQRKYDCPVIHAGDLFDHWKPSPYLLSKTFENLPEQFWTVYGNHDLPYHGIDSSHKSGVYTLVTSGRITLLPGIHWGRLPSDDHKGVSIPSSNRKILVWHIMTYIGKDPWPGCTDPSADTLLKRYSQFDLILTGHNHKCFMKEQDERILLNPGALTRQTVDQIDHKPCVFLYHADTNTVEKVYIPITENVMSREHIDIKERRDARIEAFVERLNTEWQKGVSFEENLEQFLNRNDISNEIITYIRKAVDYETN